MGYPHPDALFEDLSSTQISEWEAYNRLDPIGRWRDDYHMANLITYMVNIVNTLYGPKGGAQRKPLDFMPDWGAPVKDPVITIKEQLLSFAEEHNRRYRREQEEKKRKLKEANYGSGDINSNTGSKRNRPPRSGSLT